MLRKDKEVVDGTMFVAKAKASVNGACLSKLVMGGLTRTKGGPTCCGTTVDKGSQHTSKDLVPNSTLFIGRVSNVSRSLSSVYPCMCRGT